MDQCFGILFFELADACNLDLKLKTGITVSVGGISGADTSPSMTRYILPVHLIKYVQA